MANRTMSWVWLCSSEVLESITEPTRPDARSASGSVGVVVIVGPLVSGLVGRVRACSVCRVRGSDLHRQLLRQRGQALRAVVVEQDAPGQLVPPAVQPHAQDDVEGQPGAQP